DARRRRLMAIDRPGGRPVDGSAGRSAEPLAATLVGLAPLALVVVAEAAWIAVLGGLFQEVALRASVLGIPVLAGFVAAGVLAGPLLGPRPGSQGPLVALGLVVGRAAIGWGISGEARDAAGAGIGPALAAHPGGLLAGLAMLRGYAHSRLPLAEDTVG